MTNPVTVISTVMTRQGEFEVRADGAAVGMFSILEHVPATGRALHPTVAAGHIAAALTDLYNAVADTEMRYRAKGWTSEADYHAQIEATRSVLIDMPTGMRDTVAEAFARHGWTQPLTPEQMTAWQDEVLDLVTANDPTELDDETGAAA